MSTVDQDLDVPAGAVQLTTAAGDGYHGPRMPAPPLDPVRLTPRT